MASPGVLVMREFFDRVRRVLFDDKLSQSQVDGLNTLLESMKGYYLSVPQQAYILATAYHETGKTMQPVMETFASSEAQAISRLDAAWRAGKMPQVTSRYWGRHADTGRSYLGRGYVQLTHYTNYDKASRKLGVDLVKNPDLAMRPEYAAKILIEGMSEGWFTGAKLGDYIGAALLFMLFAAILLGAAKYWKSRPRETTP
jgi:hypothetical protein